MSLLRLDKWLCLDGECTRSQAAALIRSGRVSLQGVALRNPGQKVPLSADICLDGEPLRRQDKAYFLFYKPAGVLTAARDRHAPTVVDLLPPAWGKRRILPVGRLDKETTGLLLLTNDGALAHTLLSPQRHVWKTYEATVDGPLTPEDVEAFAQGLPLGDFTALPARLTILQSDASQSLARVQVREGKFHQIKRMFERRGRTVTALHRSAFGSLALGDLQPGEYRPRTPEEVQALQGENAHGC